MDASDKIRPEGIWARHKPKLTPERQAWPGPRPESRGYPMELLGPPEADLSMDREGDYARTLRGLRARARS